MLEWRQCAGTIGIGACPPLAARRNTDAAPMRKGTEKVSASSRNTFLRTPPALAGWVALPGKQPTPTSPGGEWWLRCGKSGRGSGTDVATYQPAPQFPGRCHFLNAAQRTRRRHPNDSEPAASQAPFAPHFPHRSRRSRPCRLELLPMNAQCTLVKNIRNPVQL